MAYENQYKGRKVHSQSELESICEEQYEVIIKLSSLVQSCSNSFVDIRNFDEDTEQLYDDAGHIANISLRVIKEKLSEL